MQEKEDDGTVGDIEELCFKMLKNFMKSKAVVKIELKHFVQYCLVFRKLFQTSKSSGNT